MKKVLIVMITIFLLLVGCAKTESGSASTSEEQKRIWTQEEFEAFFTGTSYLVEKNGHVALVIESCSKRSEVTMKMDTKDVSLDSLIQDYVEEDETEWEIPSTFQCDKERYAGNARIEIDGLGIRTEDLDKVYDSIEQYCTDMTYCFSLSLDGVEYSCELQFPFLGVIED